MSGTPQRTGAAPTFDCSGHVAASMGGRNFNFRIGATPKSIFHYCEHCGEPVVAGMNGWRHVQQIGCPCTQIITNPVVGIVNARALKRPGFDREAEWAQERAELQFEHVRQCDQIVFELADLYDRCVCEPEILLARDRCERIEALIKEFLL